MSDIGEEYEVEEIVVDIDGYGTNSGGNSSLERGFVPIYDHRKQDHAEPQIKETKIKLLMVLKPGPYAMKVVGM
ncbi:hypothetical protein Tco_0633732 [Tanacetum coccineum]